MSRIEWDDDWRYRLISLVYERPSIWNTAHSDYFNKSLKAGDWETVAAVLSQEFGVQINCIEAANQWKMLKDTFVRITRKMTSGVAVRRKPGWRFMKAIGFLSQRGGGGAGGDDDEQDVSQSSISDHFAKSVSPPPTKSARIEHAIERVIHVPAQSANRVVQLPADSPPKHCPISIMTNGEDECSIYAKSVAEQLREIKCQNTMLYIELKKRINDAIYDTQIAGHNCFESK